MNVKSTILTKGKNPVHPLAAIGGASLFLALFAQISIPVPFSPVPVTGQTLALLLIAAWLTPSAAVYAVSLYLLEGAAGLPVFAGFSGGFQHLIGPTGGYLLAFVPAAYVMSKLTAGLKVRSLPGLIAGGTLALAIVFSGGLLWLSRFVDAGLIHAGLTPFIPGALLKISAAAIILKASLPRS